MFTLTQNRSIRSFFAAFFLLALLTAAQSMGAAQTTGVQTAGDKAGAKPAQVPPGLDAFVAKVMKTFEVPGIGLAIVKDGRVVTAKGFGVRKMGEAAPVDARTLFGIASNTKVFTAAALGILADQGKLAWDGRVIEYLPWFQLGDPYVTRELTIRDLLVHRSGLGLGAGDLLIWPPSAYSRKEIARRLRNVPLARSFRSAYAYDNVLYIVAGEVIEAVSGLSWEDFVAENILKKVGMISSQVRYSPAANGGNVAGTHARIEGVVRPVVLSADDIQNDNVNPAGGINSNAEDMARWILVLLNGGRLADGSRLFSERTARELVTLVTPMPNPLPQPELFALRANFRGYALGLNVHDYRGRTVVTHTGGLTGYVSKVTMLPELNLGIAVLTNQESGEAYSSLTWHIVDHYLGAPPTDWVTAYLKVRERTRARYADSLKKASAARDASSRPSLALEKYAGTYQDAWYGDIEIALESGKLIMRFTKTPALVGDLEHWQYDTFVVRWRDRELRADAFVTFALNPDGSIERAKMKAVSEETDFSYDFHDLVLIRKAK
jgi:CubicO group peptidase (beta-lactamase class C family)